MARLASSIDVCCYRTNPGGNSSSSSMLKHQSRGQPVFSDHAVPWQPRPSPRPQHDAWHTVGSTHWPRAPCETQLVQHLPLLSRTGQPETPVCMPDCQAKSCCVLWAMRGHGLGGVVCLSSLHGSRVFHTCDSSRSPSCRSRVTALLRRGSRNCDSGPRFGQHEPRWLDQKMQPRRQTQLFAFTME